MHIKIARPAGKCPLRPWLHAPIVVPSVDSVAAKNRIVKARELLRAAEVFSRVIHTICAAED
jgi:hypothetical protein